MTDTKKAASLDGKIITVVGGAQGIGRATAELCATRGARVIIADQNSEAGLIAADQINGLFCVTDVASEESVRALFEQVKVHYGKLDVLIQTAGVLRGPYVPIEDFDVAMFRSVLDINVTGSFLCAKYAVPLLRAAERGVIVLVSSMASVAGSSSYAYGTSKGGLDALAITLAAKHEADHIRVNVVRPGSINTAMKLAVIAEDARRHGEDYDKMVTNQGLGNPSGVAQVLAWLASDDADYVRGVIQTR